MTDENQVAAHEMEWLVPKDCWAAEFTEEEHFYAIREFVKRKEAKAVEAALSGFVVELEKNVMNRATGVKQVQVIERVWAVFLSTWKSLHQSTATQ